MITFIGKQKKHPIYRMISGLMAFTFIFSVVIPPSNVFAQSIPTTVLNLPLPGSMVPLTSGFTPVMIDGITIHPDDPFKFDFLVGRGDNHLEGEELTNEAKKLIKYFLASLTVPEEELWVNLSPYEEDRIIPDSLSQTEMGRDLLAQDYMLKQLTASLMYPENELGEKFWNRIREKVQNKYGITDIPVDTFNKVWIVPQDATIYESQSTAIVIDSYLKVMLESDYLALQNAKASGLSLGEQSPSTEIIKEIIIPAIEKEVNEGETFANLRQIYNSMILATWYKKNLKASLLGQVYIDQKKVSGIDTVDKNMKDKIYQQYLKAFEVGVYNYIKEEYDPTTRETIPRKYFAGGSSPVREKNIISKPAGENRALDVAAARRVGGDIAFTAQLRRPSASSPVKDNQPDELPKAAELIESLVKGASAFQHSRAEALEAIGVLETQYGPNADIVQRGKERLSDLPPDAPSSSPVLAVGSEPSSYGPHASQEGLKPLYERIAWARKHAPDALEIQRVVAFEDQKHGMNVKPAISFAIVLKNGVHINQNASVMGGISAGKNEPRTHASIEEAIEFFNEHVSDRLVGLNIGQPEQITKKLIEIDKELRAQADDKDRPQFSYIGSEISVGVSMMGTIALAEALGVPTPVVINYRYNEFALTHDLATEMRPMSIPVNYSVVWEGGKHGVAKYLHELVKEGIIQDGSRFPERFTDARLIAKKDKSILLAMVPPQELQVMVLSPTWDEARKIGIKLTEKYRKLLESNGIRTKYGAESGYTTDQMHAADGKLITLELTLDILDQAVDSLDPQEVKYVRYALDLAAGEMYIPEIDMYYIGPDAAARIPGISEESKKDGLVANAEFTQYKLGLLEKYGRFLSVEDWADDTEPEHWEDAKQIMDQWIQMGDDFDVSLAYWIKKYAQYQNAHLQKPNQSAEEETAINAVATSHNLGNVVVASHRGTRSAQETYTALFAIGAGVFAGKWTLWGPGRGALIAAMTQTDAVLNKITGSDVNLPYQGALVLDPDGPYKNVGWAKRVRAEITASSPILSNAPETILAALTPAQRKMVTKERTVDTNEDLVDKAKAAGLDDDRAAVWAAHVGEVMGLRKGKFVVVTPDNIEKLKALARQKGVLTDVGNGTDVANSHEDDVQRVPKRTGTVLSNPKEAGKFHNRKSPEVLAEVLKGYEGSLKGGEDETLYIIPYYMEPEGGIRGRGEYFSKPSIHITPDLYVAIGVQVMVANSGKTALDRIKQEGDFFMALTNPGDLNRVKRAGDILIVDDQASDFEKLTREGEYAVYEGETIQLLSVFVVEEGKAVRKNYRDQGQIQAAIDARKHGLKHVERIQLKEHQRLHVVTDAEDERHILAVPELDLGISIHTAFGGNAFINKKIEALRIENRRTVEALSQGKYRMIAHIALIEYTDPETGNTYTYGYEGPSNSGKTAFATSDSPNIKTISDDLMKAVMDMETGDVWVAQPEGAIFAVMRNTNSVTNNQVLQAVGPGTGTIFTNMAFNPTLNTNDRVWWAGLTHDNGKPLPYPHSIKGLRDYRGKLVTERAVTQAHVDVDPRYKGRDIESLSEQELNDIRLTMMDLDHANGRGTTRLENVPGLSPNAKKWVKLDGIFFGGRMEKPGKIPLVTHITDVTLAQHQRMFNMQVQQTAAEQGSIIGKPTIESRAMNPFYGVRVATDANHQLAFWRKQRELAEKAGHKPVEFFQGNWIHPKVFGMEGFKLPEKVIHWAVQQIKGVGNYEVTAIGNIPVQGAFDLSGFRTITQEKIDQVRSPNLEEAKRNVELAWEFAMSEPGASKELHPDFLAAQNQLRANLGMDILTVASSPVDGSETGEEFAQLLHAVENRTLSHGGDERIVTDGLAEIVDQFMALNILSDVSKGALVDHSLWRLFNDATVREIAIRVTPFMNPDVPQVILITILGRFVEEDEGVRKFLESVVENPGIGWLTSKNSAAIDKAREALAKTSEEKKQIPSQDDDLAMFATASSPVSDTENVGGIDLDAEHLNLKVERDGKGIPLPVSLQPIETININGLVPIIINMAPVNMPLIFGSVAGDGNEPFADTESEKSLDSARNKYFDKIIADEELTAI